MWIANSGNQTIQWIHTADGSNTVSAQSAAIPGAAYFYGALIDENNNMWILDQTGAKVFRYTIANFPDISETTVKSVSTPGTIYGFTITPDGYVWAGGYGGGLFKIDPDTVTIIESHTTAEYVLMSWATFGTAIMVQAARYEGTIRGPEPSMNTDTPT